MLVIGAGVAGLALAGRVPHRIEGLIVVGPGCPPELAWTVKKALASSLVGATATVSLVVLVRRLEFDENGKFDAQTTRREAWC